MSDTMLTIEVIREKTANINKIVSSLINEFSEVVITTQEEMKRATEILGIAKARAKEIETMRTTLVAPYNAHVKDINNLFKGELEPLAEFEAKIKKAMVAWQTEQERLAEIERRKEELRIAEDKKKMEEVLAKETNIEKKAELELELTEKESAVSMQPSPATIVRGGTSSTNFKKIWTFEVQDLSIVPREFLMVDEKKLLQAIKDGLREVNGVKVFQKTSVAIR